MSDETFKRSEPRTDAATVAAGVTGAIALAFCCAGGLIAAGLGLGALAAFLVSPWFLFPAMLITAGIVYWQADRAPTCCDVMPHERSYRNDESTTAQQRIEGTPSHGH
jgi:hypothetical protein